LAMLCFPGVFMLPSLVRFPVVYSVGLLFVEFLDTPKGAGRRDRECGSHEP
jgi:hypothetical protein